MQDHRKAMRPSKADKSGGYDTERTTAGKGFMRFQCASCNHCVSPGMFTTEGWAAYKQTGLCPDCQK